MSVTLPNFPGTFVTTYAADVVADNPFFKRIIWDPFKPKPPQVFVRQSTIIIFAFGAITDPKGKSRHSGQVSGKIQLNRGGFSSPETQPFEFAGKYELALNSSLQVFEGTLTLALPTRTQDVFVVCKDNDTILFMLRGSTYSDADGIEPTKHPSMAVVQGVMERVR